KKTRDAIRGLSADREPVLAALDIELHPIGIVLFQKRIVGANLLDVPAIARRRAVGDHDVIVRALLCATTSKADLYSHYSSSFSFIRVGHIRISERGANRFAGKHAEPLRKCSAAV